MTLHSTIGSIMPGSIMPGSIIAWLLLSAVTLGCAAHNEEREETVSARLRACGLLTEGALGADLLYSPSACYQECLSTATCDELQDALCGTSIDLLVDCDARCAFECGDGSLLALEEVCDGRAQCEDESDEASCGEPSACARRDSGADVVECDGVRQCADGSDERACEFDCGDGVVASPDARCNGWEQCPNGADEVGCAELTLMCDPAT
jgi:hypothetical protein